LRLPAHSFHEKLTRFTREGGDTRGARIAKATSDAVFGEASGGRLLMDQPTLGPLVRDLRRAAGLTQEELAARAGLSTRAISDLERGINHTPRPTTLQLLVAALGLAGREREHFHAVARAHEVNSDGHATNAPPRASDPAAARARGAFAPLIGRAGEVAILEQHLAGEGPPVLLVAGEPGIGKTRLLQEAAAQAARFQLNVLHGTVLSAGDADSLDPVADSLRRALEHRSPVLLRRDLQGCEALVHMLPELMASGWAGTESVREAVNPVLAASAVLRFIANTRGPAGTLLTLDNLHEAASPGLALLVRLVKSSTNWPVRIVGAYRDGHCNGRDPLSTVLAPLAHEQLVRFLHLPHLSTRQGAELLSARAMQRGQSIDPWPAQALHDSGGVPFYLAAWAEDLGSGQRHGAEAAVPWSIQQSVRFRINAGPASVRPLLEVLAAMGGRATRTVLRDVVALPMQDLQTAIEWCLAERLLAEDDQAYDFAYGVIRSAVEFDLSSTRRRSVRRRLATLLHRHGQGLALLAPAKRGPRALGPKGATSRISASENERDYHLAVLRQGRRAESEEH
jgi:transcriptional regulator with XRE-family HTH domain